MPTISRILAPIDFSERCQGAVQYAEALACHFHGELVLLHVVPPVQCYGFPDAIAVAPELEDDLLAHGDRQLQQFMGDAFKGITVRRHLIQGDPAPAIVEYAREGRFDLIVMPTHGYGPFRRFLLGSVTAKVLHDAHCPVWTGPHLENAPEYTKIGFGKILCAIDLGPDSRTVLEWAAGLAREYGSALSVVHAISGANVSMGGLYFDQEWSNRAVEECRQHIENLLRDIGTTAEILVRVGEAASVVDSAADICSANLLVIGRGRHDGVLGRLRTHAYAILRESPCPVVAI